MKQVGSLLWDNFNVFQIFGANTGVGKTIVSTLLAKRFGKINSTAFYLKPVQTGSDESIDSRHLKQYATNLTQKTLFRWGPPVSPHLAARYGGPASDDKTILEAVHDELVREGRQGRRFAIVETAGGVLSPAPSGTLQADLYRPLRLPALLVGDHRLGGIGATISAWESLRIRGYDVAGLLMFKDEIYENSDYLVKHFQRQDPDLPIALIDQPPPMSSDNVLDGFNMRRYYEKACRTQDLIDFEIALLENVEARKTKLTNLANRAHQTIWHPFMQHTERSPDTIFAIDSAHGDYFQAVRRRDGDSSHESLLGPAFDGSASWWTQGLGHGNPNLALTAAYAAGRYGHVMFANAAHEPAVSLAERMLARNDLNRDSTQRPPSKQTRAFYSDNGSTGMEVAVKMALKAATKRYGWQPDDHVEVVGLKGSYHGDTIGAMDLSEGNIYNEKVEWYTGKGHWLDFPKITLKNGKWRSTPPPGTEDVYGAPVEFDDLNQVFDLEERKPYVKRCVEVIRKMLEHLVSRGHKLGALVIEPVILGAGGMMFVDPAFQKALVNAARSVSQGGEQKYFIESQPEDQDVDGTTSQTSATTVQEGKRLQKGDWLGMPLITDEVFTGIYRLGKFQSSTLLRIVPDVSVHAKLLTGGVIPLAVTLASESIYSAFLSDDKSDALLHGHSYTAHAMGCEIALASLKQYWNFNQNFEGSDSNSDVGRWIPFKKDWDAWTPSSRERYRLQAWREDRVWSMWSSDFVHKLSHRDDVDGMFALGSVLAIEIKDPEGAGYASKASIGIREKLLKGVPHLNQAVHCRILGNVLYFMASMTTTPETIASIQEQIEEAMR
ncbi:aminotransferase class-III-like protein 1 [Elsinoe australis]|uniref:Aminotransferase class-III-like protein 1 n=1 Tax=Elsinoe australis TaxID=40998 RepID=A0A4U7B9Z0_9PEZI|nr:aminotransferase class-III-like protein 1 [Elsinoe australis]